VLVFEFFPAFITLVATIIAVVLFVIARRKKGDPERKREMRDPTRSSRERGRRFTRPSMRG
jgi:hypothetical protein